MIAALLRRAVRTCRSTQLAETLSFPPTNQRASGDSHSSTASHGRIHSSSRAKPAQKPSGSCSARAYTSGSFTCATSWKAAGGGNARSSVSRLEISELDCGGWDIGLNLERRGR
jgi:hypothetical protein